MSPEPSGTSRQRGGLPEKRKAIAAAARAVFAREGYTRASVDAIAAEAGVSKRTIYNHYRDKEQLFLLTIQESAVSVAAAHLDLIQHGLCDLEDLEGGLVAFGRAWVVPQPDFEDHFALVRVIIAEAARLPEAVLQGWLEAGPRPVTAGLTKAIGELVDRGLLVTDDLDETVRHFVLLVNTEVLEQSFHHAIPLPAADLDRLVRSGVRTFLRLYRP
ncbi:TetR/AcrR family transcriptional regulator [Saccharothrix algeriensis]|uniref:AcrR family transcriptional regulator n=1 Tax=Saccharothrix algeriensis TaxID=173560 RepID=A0A8T8HWP1_9PSEU|nr:TetR/AcrR family transcriptional regulator [Saccharothrix algeriensis]MBM7814530.1 AcrR family transcriptional regulator [Saccharothrix algeriensis]QTR02827.1 TetR/AcrR family transcriptional regulator [Saccharothrix algeriensis]